MAKSRSKKNKDQEKDWRPVQGTIAFDFDGVLHSNPHYAWTFSEISIDLITEAHERGYAVAVMTCNDVPRVADELRKHGLKVFADRYMNRAGWHDPEVVLVTSRKIAATAYVDDRAISYRYGQPTSAVFDAVEGLQGFKPCLHGRHWGPYGGAGVLPWTEFRGQLYVLLGKRSSHVQQGGTWSAFGGALDFEHEDTWVAAQRELREEVDGLDGHVTDWSDYYSYVCPGCGWGYITFLAEVPAADPGEDQDAWLPRARAGDHFETDRVRWVRVADVDSYELHSGFAEAWPSLRKRLESYVQGVAA